MCALAVWTVPTFAFGLVGVACLLVARRQVRVLVAWAGTVLVVAVGLYLPILRGVVNARTTWGSQAAPLVYSGNVLRNSLYLTAFGPATYVLAACAVGAGVLVWAFRGGRVQPPEGSEHVGQVGREAIADSSDVLPFLTVYAATHLVLLEMGGLSRILHTPYQRNSVFVAFVILLWLLRLCRSPHQRFRRLARLVLAANLLVSAVGISMLVTGHDYSVQRYDVVLRTAPPTTLRSGPSTGATARLWSSAPPETRRFAARTAATWPGVVWLFAVSVRGSMSVPVCSDTRIWPGSSKLTSSASASPWANSATSSAAPR